MTFSSHDRWFLSCCWCLAACLCLSCAGQILPPGGPPDTVPPVVLHTVPDTNAVRVATNNIELEFSKYVDRRSVEESIFISPYVGDLEFDWSGRSVMILFTQPLRKNTTYVVNVGTDVRDVRAGNRMASGFALAFATGDSIDQGSVSGRVYDEKPEGVMIFAYALRGIDPDTLNPAHTRPDYITQTGKGGLFSLSHLSYNTYRVLAVRDEFRNLVYDVQTDQYGVGPADIVLDVQHPAMRDLGFRLSGEDTTRPFVTGARALDCRRIGVSFSEPLDSLAFARGRFSVRDTVTGKLLPVVAAFLLPQAPASAGLVTGAEMDSGAAYRLAVRDVADRAGNTIDTLHASESFAGSGVPDTVRPRIAFSVKDSTRGVSPRWPVRLTFSEPVDPMPLRAAITLTDSSKKPLAADLRWLSPVELNLAPESGFRYGAWYQVRVKMDSVVDAARNLYRDSTLTLRFQTLDLRTTGTVEGTVRDDRQEPGPVVLTAARTDATQTRVTSIVLQRAGDFLIDKLPEGMYGVHAYLDADSSGSYTYGSPFPFKPSERFAVSQDTVKVRARWGVQGVIIRLK